MNPYIQAMTLIFASIAALNAFAGLVGKIEEFWRSRARFTVHSRALGTEGFETVLSNVGSTPAQDVVVHLGPDLQKLGVPLRRDMIGPKDEIVLDLADHTSDLLAVQVDYMDVAKRRRRSLRRLRRGRCGFEFLSGDDVALGVTLERRTELGGVARVPTIR